ncbi:gas vesicle protein [Cytobacillus eiseniae]|uniref:Gas vesicle protein n=1 Tax=Cytobacillus eiseniae TaxID=762947 RepID=A0ABS4RG20_9BACI|nr:YtxH domain-containing protein [Cytobacillus eiseniae]MBP2241843.1 gas vesicle protein [Cytobacillus eiseniae]
MGKSLFWKGVILGAVAGGALSLLDKSTRQTVASNCKKTTSEISYYVKHPNVVVNQIKEVSSKIKNTVEQVTSEVAFIADRVEELQDGTPDVFGLVEKTKDAFLGEEMDEAYKEWPLKDEIDK